MIGLDNRTGPMPALLAKDVERLIRAANTTRPAELARAYGISVRSVYRYRSSRVEWVEVDGHRIAFLCRPGHPPVVLATRSRRVAV